MKLDLSLHKAQLNIFNNPSKHKLTIASRRFGKTRLLLTTAIVKTLTFNQHYDPLSPPSVVLVAETLKQCKALFWSQLLSFFEGKPFVKQVNKQELSIHFHGNKPSILLRGCDNDGDTLRGLKIYFAGVDEIQQISRSVIDEVITPALMDTANSSSLYIGTPKGKNNIAYDLKLKYENPENKNYSYFHHTAYDNPFLSEKTIQELEQTLSSRAFRQELMADFLDFPGQCFTEADPDKHLVALAGPKEEGLPYYIGVDPGAANLAMSLFYIDAYDDYTFKIVDSFYENNGDVYTTDDTIRIAANLGKDKFIKRIFIPNDSPQILKSFREKGFRQAVSVTRNKPDPIQRASIVNDLFKQNRIKFDISQKDFFNEMISYHRATDDQGKVIEKIAENQVDHRIDSLLYGIGRLTMNYTKLLVSQNQMKSQDTLKSIQLLHNFQGVAA